MGIPLQFFGWRYRSLALGVLASFILLSSCRSEKRSSSVSRDGISPATKSRNSNEPAIRRVHCVFDEKPWLNLDRYGDRDPEGIRFRAFLDTGDGRTTMRKGTFHIEMYTIERDSGTGINRNLVSDWHYPTEAIHTIAQPGLLGQGYFLHLRWSRKDVAGKEIEIITEFEDSDGNRARSGTKRFRIPHYSS